MIKLVVDMEGGDFSYTTTIPAVDRFLTEFPDSMVYACGKEEKLIDLKLKFQDRIIVINAPQEVPMHAGALEVLRLKDSAIMRGLELLKDGTGDCMVSAGSTGGFLSAATIKLKTIDGIKRAALVSPFPTFKKGKQTIILDIGANNENNVDELLQFALMGRIYSQKIVGIKEPRVYLLSNGSEDQKGSPLVKETHKALKEMNFPGFVGNIEGNNALNGEADVIVSDGFTGNVFLKSCEGVAKYFGNEIKTTYKKNILSKIAYLLVKKSVNNTNETMKYKHLGGAMLLGINGVCVKAHGNSLSEPFYYSMRIAYQQAKMDVVNLIREGLKNEFSTN